jgi:hypothetical protein
MKGVTVDHPDFRSATLSTVLKFQRGKYLAQIQQKREDKTTSTILQVKETYAKGNPLKWANQLLASAASLEIPKGAVHRSPRKGTEPSDRSCLGLDLATFELLNHIRENHLLLDSNAYPMRGRHDQFHRPGRGLWNPGSRL